MATLIFCPHRSLLRQGVMQPLLPSLEAPRQNSKGLRKDSLFFFFQGLPLRAALEGIFQEANGGRLCGHSAGAPLRGPQEARGNVANFIPSHSMLLVYVAILPLCGPPRWSGYVAISEFVPHWGPPTWHRLCGHFGHMWAA